MPGAAMSRARLAVVMAAVLLAVACGGGGSKESGEGEPSQTQSETDSASPSAAEPTESPTYELHKVDPPGKRKEPLVGDDMLIVGKETLDDELIEELTKLKVKGQKAFSAAEVMSVGQISAEGEVYDVAAVDLAGYRRFTPQQTADEHPEHWERLANGEFAADRGLEGRLPLDQEAFLAAGSGEDVDLIHLGAWGDQAANMDIVVNEEWGEVLGLPKDNALLVATGLLSVQAVRPEVEKLLGKEYFIQDLDAVEEFGLDPDAFALIRPVGTFGDAVGVFRYRPLEGGRIAPDPAWVSSHIVTEQVPILGQLTCNKHMMPQLKAALIEVQDAGLADEIRYHVGCYYPRFIAGSTTLSNHSFGLAIDINSRENQRGTVGQMHRGVVAIFKRWGFAWGGDWGYTDPMHFELSRIVNPG